MNPTPSVMPVSNVHPKHWRDYKPNPDLETGRRCVGMLRDAGFEVEEDPNRTWMIDVFPILVAMFPNGCPPVTVVSLNSHFDPFDHARMGTVLRPLREEGYLFIGSGGGVHNLYRTEWKYMNKYKDNFAMERPPDRENIEFRTALEDVIVKNGGGPKLRRGLARLMKHPYFRDAHGTDEHYIPALFIAGAIGEPEDEGAEGLLGAELWELVRAPPYPRGVISRAYSFLSCCITAANGTMLTKTQRNQGETQFTIGKWTKGKYYGGWKKATAITA